MDARNVPLPSREGAPWAGSLVKGLLTGAPRACESGLPQPPDTVTQPWHFTFLDCSY